jgi:hypothetical protein
VIRKISPVLVPSSITDLVVTPAQGVGRDADENLQARFDLILGYVLGTPDFQLQMADSPGTWVNVRSFTDVPANVGTVCTFTPGSQSISSTAHGLVEGQLVSLYSTTQLPTALRAGQHYIVNKVISANALEIIPYNVTSFASNSINDAGSGTHRIVPIKYLTTSVLETVVADQSSLPTRGSFRWTATTVGGELAQVLGMVIR